MANNVIPAHNLNAEKAVLGSMIFAKAAIYTADEILSVSDFYDARHQIIFVEILKLSSEQKPVDLLTLPESLSNSNQLDKAGGITYLAELAAQSGTGANVKHHAKIISEASQRRYLRDLGHKLIADVEDNKNPAEIATNYSKWLADASVAGQQEDGVEFDQIHTEVAKAYEERAERTRQGIPYAGLDCGFANLNFYLNGLCDHELTVIAARTSIGKTTLGLEMALAVASAGHNVVIFTLEMPRNQIGDWIERLAADLDPGQFRTGSLDSMAYNRWKSEERIPKLPITIFEHRKNIPQMRSQMQRISRTRPVALWVIDYLQLIPGPGRKSKYEDVSYVADELKAMSKEFSGHTLALAQLNRNADSRDDKVPYMADLRDSGNIEQSADNVGLIYRPGFYDSMVREEEAKKKDGDVAALMRFAEVHITKCKNGPTGHAKLCWVPDRAYFTDEASVVSTENTLDFARIHK